MVDEQIGGQMSYVEELDEEFAEAEEEPYRVTRLLLAPEYRDLPDEHIEAILESAFPGMSPEDAEGFLSDVGRAFSNVGREIVRRGPEILAGATTGLQAGSVAGPWGALVGAAGGAIAGGLTARPGQLPAAPGVPPGPAAPPGTLPPGVVPPGVVPAGVVPPGAVAPGAVPGVGAPAAGRQLAAMFAQPQTWQAMLASLLGQAGRQSLPAGGGQLGTGSVLAALGNMSARAAEDLTAEASDGESVPLYLMDAEGNYVVDPANPDARADRLLGVLSEANLSLALADYDEGFGYDDDYEYDESDLGETDD